MMSFFLVLRPIASLVYEGPLASEDQMPTSLWVVSFKILAIFAWVSLAVSFLLRIATDLMQALAEQTVTDALSGVLNRRGFFERAEPVVRQATAVLPATVLICDIDRFKGINDTYGHRVGDLVIQGLAKVLRDVVGENGIIGRLGGEEFAVVLPTTDTRSAVLVAEGIRTAFAHTHHEGIPSSRHPTVSIGMAERYAGEALDSALDRADAALYCAKRSGRDRVEYSVPPTRHPGGVDKIASA
jgi:diguanylate cyclase (GGDEF)-like protein